MRRILRQIALLITISLIYSKQSQAMLASARKKPATTPRGTIYIPGEGYVGRPLLTATELRKLRESHAQRTKSTTPRRHISPALAQSGVTSATSTPRTEPRRIEEETPRLAHEEVKEVAPTEPTLVRKSSSFLLREQILEVLERSNEAMKQRAKDDAFIAEQLLQPSKDHDKLVQEAVDAANAVIGKQDAQGRTILHNIAIRGSIKEARELIKAFPHLLYIGDNRGYLPIHDAASMGNYEMVKLFVTTDQELATVLSDHNNTLPIHLAAQGNHAESLFKLLQAFPNGAKVADKNGMLPLHWAAYFGNPAIIKALIKRFPEGVKHRDTTGTYPIDIAREKDFPEHIITLLIPHENYDLNAPTARQIIDETLQRAEAKRAAEEASLARKDSIVFTEEPPLVANDSIVFQEEKEGEAAPVKEDRDDWTPLHHAITQNDLKALSTLRIDDETLTAQDNYGQSPLHLAARFGRIKALRTFADKITKKSANLKDESGMTPLHKAALNGNNLLAELLIHHGADVTCVDNDKNTIAHIAAMSNGSGLLFTLINEYKIDPQAVNRHGKTPIDLAVENGNFTAVLVLKDGISEEQRVRLLKQTVIKLKDLKSLPKPSDLDRQISLGTAIDAYQRIVNSLQPPVPVTTSQPQQQSQGFLGTVKRMIRW